MIPVSGNLNPSAFLHKLGGTVGRAIFSQGPGAGARASTGTTPEPDKFSTTNLTYPLNVEGDPQQGHYISFFARVIDNGQLTAVKDAKGRIDATKARIKAEVGEAGSTSASGQAMENIIASHAISGHTYAEDRALASSGGSQMTNSIQIQNRPTVRTKTAISLYMPPSVQVSYESKYGDQEIGILAETGYNAIKAFTSGASTKDQVMSVLGDAGQAVKQATLKALEVAAPGAKALFAIDRGKIVTPKMELMFEGIGRRNFSFAFVFIPKSEQESQVVKEIVYKFKYHMAANYEGGGANGWREMSFPDMFDIEYMHIGKQNPNLNKIATCALTKMDVEYGGDRYVSYEGGAPQTTKLSLSFTEFDIITKDHIEQGY